MELKDFITESLKQITEGIIKAQKEIDMAVVNPARDISQRDNVSFDIAVSVSKKKDSAVGFGLNVLSISGSAQKGKGETSYSESRIRFSVPVEFPGK